MAEDRMSNVVAQSFPVLGYLCGLRLREWSKKVVHNRRV